MMQGWLKLHRELLNKPIWKQSTPEQKVILIALLCMVNHSESEWEWKGKTFMCKPGQRITSIDSIVEACGKGISVKNVRTALERFEKLGFLANESASTGRLITIENWAYYQAPDDEGGKETGRRTAYNRQSSGSQVASKKNEKNEKNEKKDKKDNKTIKSVLELAPPEMVPALRDFVEMRQTIKAPLTARALELLIGKVNKLSGGEIAKSIAILNQSIENGWKGVYEIKDSNTGWKDVNKCEGSGNIADPLKDSYERLANWAEAGERYSERREAIAAAFVRGDF